MSKFKNHLIKLIKTSGGEVVDNLFVTKPGVKILQESVSTPFAKELYKSFNIESDKDYLSAGEFKGRITYLSFKNESTEEQAKKYHDLMIKKLKHLSVYAGNDITFLIAGCTIETALEFIAHNESRVARLTSSKTRAMSDTLYRIQEPGIEKQKEFIKKFLQLREQYSKDVIHEKSYKEGAEMNTELFNILNIGAKATAFTYSMTIKDLHKLFIGRIGPEGNEKEMIEICSEMCRQLHEKYPDFFDSPEIYWELNTKGPGNAEKLNIG